MLKINGTSLPAPKTYNVGIQDLNNAERNAKGDMLIDRIATKRKLELEWGVLNQEDMSLILNLVKDTFFEVEYFDPQDGETKIGTFYAGDRNAPMISFMNGRPIFKQLKCNIIER